MAQKITIYEGVSKEKKIPYKALLIEVGEWSKLVFVDSKFEMEYIEKQLNPATNTMVNSGKTILDDDEEGVL